MNLKLSKWFFLLLIVSLPLVRPFNLTMLGLQVPYADFLFLPSVGFWLLALIQRQTRLTIDRLYIFVGIYAFALSLSTVFSITPEKSFYKLLGEFYLFGLAVLTFNLGREKKFFRQIVFAWLVGTSLTVLASFLGFTLFYLGLTAQDTNYFLSHLGSLPAGNYPRIRALFENANMMCDFLNVSLLLAILAAKLGWIGETAAKLLYVGICFAALFTLSPGLGGIVLSLGLWFWINTGKQRKLLLSKGTFASAIIIAAAIFGTTLISPDTDNTDQDFKVPFVEKNLEVSVRVLIWEDTLQTVRSNPWVGKGTGADAAMVQYRTLSGDQQILSDAHNIWLNVLGQTGLIGLAAFILLVAYLLSKCTISVGEGKQNDFTRLALSCAFIGAFLYQGLSGSFEDARHLWILIGLLTASSHFVNSEISALQSDT